MSGASETTSPGTGEVASLSEPERAPRRAHRLLAGIAAALAIAALAAGDPATAGARVDVGALARTVEAEQDHVDAIELAAWIRDRKPGLRIVDVRGAADFADFHLPNAENLSLTELARAPIGRGETVVLYSEGGTHAAQGWFFLRARGIEHVYFLRGGLYEWITEVMNPTLAADASPAERAAFARTAALSRYFGGVPRIGGPVAESDASAESAALESDASAAAGGPAAAAAGGGPASAADAAGGVHTSTAATTAAAAHGGFTSAASGSAMAAMGSGDDPTVELPRSAARSSSNDHPASASPRAEPAYDESGSPVARGGGVTSRSAVDLPRRGDDGAATGARQSGTSAAVRRIRARGC